MPRYINADEVRKVFTDLLHNHYIATQGGQYDDGTGEMIAASVDIIDRAPTEDVIPVKHAHWERCENIDENDGNVHLDRYRCSNCGHYIKVNHNALVSALMNHYCSYCGAEMNEEEI